MRGSPQFSCWISITLVKIYNSRIIINRGKNIFELVGTVLKHGIRQRRLRERCPEIWGSLRNDDGYGCGYGYGNDNDNGKSNKVSG